MNEVAGFYPDGGAMSEARIYDRRRKDRFWIHDVIIDHYGREIGAYGVAVYCYLARRADPSGKSFPRIRLIAEE